MHRFAASVFVRPALTVLLFALYCLGFSQNPTLVYQNVAESKSNATATQAFDQAGHISWARLVNGQVTSLQTSLDSKGTVRYQDVAPGSQITGFHTLDDGGVIIAATTQNSAKQDITMLYSWSADGTVFRSLALPGIARTALDPAGFVVALVKPLTGTKAILTRYDSLLIRDWSLSINVDPSQSIDSYRLVVDSSGNPFPMVPTNSTTRRIYKYNSQGSISQAWGPDSNGGYGFVDLPIKEVVSGLNGSLFVLTNTTSGNAFSVLKLDKDGNLARKPNGTFWFYNLPAGVSFAQLALNESGDVTVANSLTGEVFRLNNTDASALRMTTEYGSGLVDASDPRFLYRLHNTPEGIVIEKHDWILSVKSWSRLLYAPTPTSTLFINDLEVDRGGNIAISSVRKNVPRLGGVTYTSVFGVFQETRVPRVQTNVRNGVFSARDRSVYSPTINDLDYDWNPIHFSNLDSPYGFKFSKMRGLKFRVNLGFTSFTVNLGQFGGSIAGQIAANLDLKAKLHMSLGSFNVNYPISLLAEAPPESDPSMVAGSTGVKVKLSYSPGSTASLSTNPISVKASLGLDFGFAKNTDVTATAFSEEIFRMPLEVLVKLADPAFPLPPYPIPSRFNTHVQIFSPELVNNDYLLGQNQYENQYVNAVLQLPLFRTNGSIKDLNNQDYSISTSGSALFFDIKGYFTGFIPELGFLNEIYKLKGEGKLGNWEAQLILRWAQITGHATETFRQKFKFDPGGPVVYFLDDKGVRVKPAEYPIDGEVPLAKAGNTLTFTMPAAAVLKLTPVVTLPTARFTNSTYIDSTPAVGLSYFSGSAGITYRGIQVLGTSWDFYDEAPLTIPAKIAEPDFGVGDLGAVRLNPIVILGRNLPGPVISATSRPSLTAFLLNQEKVGQPSNYATVRNAFAAYLLSSTKFVIYGDNFNQSTTRFYFRHLGQKFELNKSPGGFSWISPRMVVVNVPNYLTVLAGNSTLIAEDSIYGSSNSFDFPVVNPLPNAATVGPNLWASDPRIDQVYITITDSGDARGSDTFLARRDYYFQLDKLWTDIFPNLPSVSSFFPDAGLKAGNTFSEPTLPLIHWNTGNGDRTLQTYGDAMPSGLLWAVLPNDYFNVASKVEVTVEASGPGGGVSSAMVVNVAAPKPVVSRILPSTVIPGSPTFLLEVDGPSDADLVGTSGIHANFNPESVAYLDGVPLKTNFITSSYLQAEVPASMITTKKSMTITVKSPSNGTTYFFDGSYRDGGGESASLTLNVASPTPILDRLSPSTVSLGAFDPGRILSSTSDTNFSVEGSGFTRASQIFIDGNPVPTTFQSTELLSATLSKDVSSTPGFRRVNVRTQEGDGSVLSSMTMDLVVNPPVRISSMVADSTTVKEGGSIALTFQGSDVAPSEGVQAFLVSSDPTLVSDRVIELGGGQKTVTVKVPVKTNLVGGTVVLTLQQFDAPDQTVTIQVTPSGTISLTFVPNRVEGGSNLILPAQASTFGNIILNFPAPKGGATVQLSSDFAPSGIDYPSTVTIPEGQTSGVFFVKTSPIVGDVAVARIRATYKITTTADLTILPVSFLLLRATPAVASRNSFVTFSVDLSQPVPSDQSVDIDQAGISANYLPFPKSIVVKQGKTHGEVLVKAVSTPGGKYPLSLNLKATYNGVTKSIVVGIK